LRIPISKPAWTSSKTTWSTQRQRSSKQQGAGHTSSRTSLRRSCS
jgi:hypothetical protein